MSSVTEDLLHHFQLLGVVEALAAIFKVFFLCLLLFRPSNENVFIYNLCKDFYKLFEGENGA